MAEDNPAPTEPKRKYVLKRAKTESAPEPEPPKTIIKAPKLQIKEQPTTIEGWAKARQLYPKLFGYTKDGDLEIAPVKPTDQLKIIALPVYVRSSKEHVESLSKQRAEEIKAPEEEYTQAKRALQKAMEIYNQSEKSEEDISEILNANQEVHDKECILNSKVKMPRKINLDYDVKESLLTLRLEDTKNVADDIINVEYTFLPIQYFWMPKSEEKDDEYQDEIQEQTMQQGGDQKVKRKLTFAAIQAIRARRSANYSRA